MTFGTNQKQFYFEISGIRGSAIQGLGVTGFVQVGGNSECICVILEIYLQFFHSKILRLHGFIGIQESMGRGKDTRFASAPKNFST